MEAERMLSLKQLKECMGISESTIFRLRRENIPPFDKSIKVRGRVLTPCTAYNDWAKSKFHKTS